MQMDYLSHAQKLQNTDNRGVQPGLFYYRWRPPPTGFYKINTNTSYIKNKKKGTAGIVIRNHLGEFVSGQIRSFPINSPLVAEVVALRDGVVLAQNLGLEKVIFENDNLMLIKACRKEEVIGEIQNLVADIFHMKVNFQACGFTWVERSGNGVAHLLAALTSHDALPINWRWSLPKSMKALIEGEKVALQTDNRIDAELEDAHPFDPGGSSQRVGIGG